MQATDFDALFSSFKEMKVGVIGDVMLDTYWWGKVDRISPEAPVPVVAVSSREERIGGAGNVALNVQALGATVHAITVLGADADGEQLELLLKKNGIHTQYMVKSTQRVTTNKIRIISRNQHMMRLDAEITHPLESADEAALLVSFRHYIETEKPQIVILEDYNKGVLTTTLIPKIIAMCKENNILTAVDPKRKNFFAYEGVTIFKPNLHEAKEGLNLLQEEVSLQMLNHIHQALHEKLHHEISFITLSEKGVFYQSSENSRMIPTHIRSIADVSGAGDTVIAVASVVYASKKDINLMAEIANIAGGLVCEEVGTVAIDPYKLLEECKHLLSPAR